MSNTTTQTEELSTFNFFDLSLGRLYEMENEVASLFPSESGELPESIGWLHAKLLDALSFRFIATGWEKKELIEMFTAMVDDSIFAITEAEKEELEA